jgi:hypothetical protein
MLELILSGLPWVAGTAAAYRAALAMVSTAPSGSLRAKLAAALGGGGPGVRT